MKKIAIGIATIAIVVIVVLFSCKKSSEEPDVSKELAQSDDVMSAQTAVLKSLNLFFSKNKDNGLKKSLGTCPTSSVNQNTYPKTYTIDFGTDGCAFGGSTVYGKIIGLATAKISSVNTQITLTFENFKIDTLQISGTISVKVNSYSSSPAALDVTSTFTDLSVTTPSGNFAVSGTQNVVWKLNNTLTIFDDDTFEVIAGSTLSGKDKSGNEYTANVTTTIAYKTSCTEPVSGVLQVVPAVSTLATTTIKFGSGECDGTITVTVKNKSTTKSI